MCASWWCVHHWEWKWLYCETGILVWHPSSHAQVSFFQVLFFRLYFNKKYVEVAVNDFTMHLIISKWLRRQKCRQEKETRRQKGIEVKE